MAYPRKLDLEQLTGFLEDRYNIEIFQASIHSQDLAEASKKYLRDYEPDIVPQRRQPLLRAPGDPHTIIAAVQLKVQQDGFDPGPIDGFWGPRTDAGVEEWRYFQKYGARPDDWRDELEMGKEAIVTPQWPVDREFELRRFYGQPGDRLVIVRTPYPLRLAWDKGTEVNRVTVHAEVAESLKRVLYEIDEQYSPADIERLRLNYYGGSYNDRPRRGSSRLSTHAWGIALDFDPDHNRLNWGRDRAAFAKPAYEKWWQAWEKEGWVSLGRQRNFDWMHVQAATL